MTHDNAHISRGENTNTRPTSPARTRGANGRRGGARVALLCVFLCPAAHFCRRNGGLRDRSTIDQPTRAPHHAKGTVVLPLGAQQGVSQIAKNKNPTSSAATAGVQPAHNTSHPMPACLHRVISICAYHRLPLLAYSLPPRYGYETCPSSRTQGTSCCRADPPRSPGSERKGTDSA